MKNDVRYLQNGDIIVNNNAYGNYIVWAVIIILTLFLINYPINQFHQSFYVDFLIKITAPFLIIILPALIFKYTGFLRWRWNFFTNYFTMHPRQFIINENSIVCKSRYLILNLNWVKNFEDLQTFEENSYSIKIWDNGIRVQIDFSNAEDTKKVSDKIEKFILLNPNR